MPVTENGAAADTAIALRATQLAATPGVRLHGCMNQAVRVAARNLVCWGLSPDEVYVWRFLQRGDPKDRVVFEMSERFVEHVSSHPLSGGLTVVAGPPFADLNLPIEDLGINTANPYERVYVSDLGGKRGVQTYRTVSFAESMVFSPGFWWTQLALERTWAAHYDTADPFPGWQSPCDSV